ncbi:MAG: DNA polymerase I [Alphaproteobacteria bacterium]|nr:DNA polymerase I [Alphaproteobacteria bacterium]
MAKVCLIDGSGYIFRAFYALPIMTAPNGTPVNAVYGFVTMFMRLMKNIPCDYCVVLLDAKRQNFRNNIFPAYKTNRAETPEMLIPQFDLIHQAIEVMGFPYVLQEGYEADDLIASYTKQALEQGHEVVVVSADKDLMQLMRPQVQFYDAMKDKFFTREDVKEKFGVYPEKIVDVQALSGDKIDNVPGVPGIGPKTAAELVNEYGSLQRVLDNADKIKQNKRRELIEQNKEAAQISLKLVTLKDDVPLEHDISLFKCCAPDAPKLLAFADELGFKSIRPKLEKWAQERGCNTENNIPEQQNIQPQVQQHIIKSRAELEDLYKQIKRSSQVALQMIYENGQVCGFNLSADAVNAFYIDLPQEKDFADLFSFENIPVLERGIILKFLQAVCEDENILKIAADLKGQWHSLNDLCGKRLNLFPYDDISVMSYDLDSSEHGHSLPELCEIFLDVALKELKSSARNKTTPEVSAEQEKYHYCAAAYVMQLHKLLKNRLFAEHKNYVYEMLDRRLIEVLLKMEEEGIEIDDKRLQELDAEFTKQLLQIEKEIYMLAGEEFNLASPKQIGDILFVKMGIKGKRTANGNFNTGAEVLEQLAEEHELAAKILEWRTYAKLKSTYTTALLEVRDKNNRVHTTFSQTVVNTGRLASSNPNLQNIPNRTEIGRKIRECFVAKKGYKLVAADYSQMELRLMAGVANVKALKEAFLSGADIHAATAAHVFGLPLDEVDREHRSRAKAINFGIIYGISQFGLAKQIGISRDDAKRYIDSYFAIMPEVKKYMEQTAEFAHRYGYVETPLGRKCAVGGINDKNQRIVSFAERAAINAPIQGGAADIVKLAMQQVDYALREQKLDAKLLLQVHDELVVEAKAEQAEQVAKLLHEIMENATDNAVKMVVETGIGDDWQSAH